MALHMRAEYDQPCVATGVTASGTLRLSVPGAIEIDNAAVGGTLYCEGAEPRVEAYVAIESMVLADTLELERVRLDLRSVTPAVGRCRLPVSKPVLKAPPSACNQLLKLKYDTLLSSFAFKFNPRHYTAGAAAGGALQSLDWTIDVSGTMRFDKLLATMPSMSTTGTTLEVGRCRSKASKLLLKARLVSALETEM